MSADFKYDLTAKQATHRNPVHALFSPQETWKGQAHGA
jgi:hypothetical protein